MMKLLWWLARPLVAGVLELLPDAPDPIEVTLPWPAWLPFWPFATVLVLVLVAGAASIAVRFLRWLYGLIPVIQ